MRLQKSSSPWTSGDEGTHRRKIWISEADHRSRSSWRSPNVKELGSNIVL